MTAPTSPPSMDERLRTDYHWTPRQREILALIAHGKTNGEIGEALGLQLSGVKWHVSEILSKLQAETREEAAEYWRRYNGLAPRFHRTFRAVGASAVAKWLAGASVAGITGGAVMVALAALNADDDENSLASATPTATESPAATRSAGTNVPSPTPDPPFFGTLVGIEIKAQTDDLSPFEVCPAVGLEPLTVPEARELLAGNGPFSMNVAALPSAVTLSDVVAPEVFTCRGDPVSVIATFRVEPGTADVNPGGGTVQVSRTTGPPQIGRSYPRSAWSEIAVAGGTGVLLTTPTGSRGAGCTAAYWDEAAGIFTWVNAFTADAPFCERMLRAVLERP